MSSIPTPVSLSHLFMNVLPSHEKTVHFLQEMGTIPSEKSCRECNSPMKLELTSQGRIGIGRFRCQRLKRHTNNKEVTYQLSTGTWLEKAHTTLQEAVFIGYLFGLELTNDQIKKEVNGYRRGIGKSTSISDETITHYRDIFRSAIGKKMDREEQEEGKLAGNVQVDESKHGSRKYERGRLVDGFWMVAVTETNPEGVYYPLRIETCE